MGFYADYQAQKVAFAKELKEKRDALTPQQQLERLDWRCGKGVGAVKERTRLHEMIANGGKPKAKAKAVVEEKPELTDEELSAVKAERKANKKANKKARKNEE